MDALREEFEARLKRAVSRFFIHAVQMGMDVALLNGKVTITLKDGQITEIAYPPKAKNK